MFTEPLIADRLYGGITEKIAVEVAKMDSEKLNDDGELKNRWK